MHALLTCNPHVKRGLRVSRRLVHVVACAKLQILRRIQRHVSVHIVLAVKLSGYLCCLSSLLFFVSGAELIVEIKRMLLGHDILQLFIIPPLLTRAHRVRCIERLIFGVSYTLVLLDIGHLTTELRILYKVSLCGNHGLTRIADSYLRAQSAVEVMPELIELGLVSLFAQKSLLLLDGGTILQPLQWTLLLKVLQLSLVVRQVEHGAVGAIQTRLRLLVVLVFLN